MKKIYIILLIISSYLSSYLNATVEQALLDWYPTNVGSSTKNTPAYVRGRSSAFEIGRTINKDEAIVIFKSWAYFKGSQENQKNCNIDAAFNNIIASTQRSLAQSIISGQLKGQIGQAVEKNLQEYGKSTRGFVTKVSEEATSRIGKFADYIKSWWRGTPATQPKE